MNRRLSTLAALVLLSVSACAQPGPGGPMMGGYGYGMGPGMMGGGYAQGCGMGPGMMGGYGWGMGPGAMGGHHGWGMGPGAMSGHHGWGMGPGRMGGYAGLPPDLTAEQRAKVADIQQEFQRKQWSLMQNMHSLAWSANGPAAGGRLDEQQARKNYDAAAALHKQMFENSLEADQRLEAVLTPQQREQMRRGWGAR